MHKKHQCPRNRVYQITAKISPLLGWEAPLSRAGRGIASPPAQPGLLVGEGPPEPPGCCLPAWLVFTEAARGCWGERCANRLQEDPPPWRAYGLIGTKETFAEGERGQRATKCFSQGHLWQGWSWGDTPRPTHGGLGATFPPGSPATRRGASSPCLSKVWQDAW